MSEFATERLECIDCWKWFDWQRKSKYGRYPETCPACRAQRRKKQQLERTKIEREAKREYDKMYRAINADRFKARDLARRRANVENKAEYDRAYRERNKEELREKKRLDYALNRYARQTAMRLRKYGITLDDASRILQSQGGCCAICRVTDPNVGKGWHIDHDHSYAMGDPRSVRGILCHNCNLGIGNFKDSPERCEAAAKYLRERAQRDMGLQIARSA